MRMFKNVSENIESTSIYAVEHSTKIQSPASNRTATKRELDEEDILLFHLLHGRTTTDPTLPLVLRANSKDIQKQQTIQSNNSFTRMLTAGCLGFRSANHSSHRSTDCADPFYLFITSSTAFGFALDFMCFRVRAPRKFARRAKRAGDFRLRFDRFEKV
ncbi:uncharacterized protein LOC131426038 [Malaya genurostris]|uniref:uncharacterized protein LOC131426038 n=1 Tax=Malaya genurostris TaxID=325434 RepID=UPI0026F3EB9C|nr:uncharacterized protein LOC131426038 [Malaya genurostris]